MGQAGVGRFMEPGWSRQVHGTRLQKAESWAKLELAGLWA
jgi:hypothetical protein